MSMKHARLFAMLVALAANAAGAGDFGRTPGSFSVSPSGASTYSVPIWTPPGPNGLTPDISLDYSSQGGNGIAGVGWNLSAVSSIERCGRTIHQDGVNSEVNYSPASDRFCMGGNRLRLVSTGAAYGAANTVYQTEIADYSRITAYGQVGSGGSGPLYFIVEAKNGLRYEYGFFAGSRVFAGAAPTVLRWMLSRVSDRSGNNYVVSYDGATGDGFLVPNTISWTPVSSGATTYRYQAKFNYIGNRTDTDSYLGRVTGIAVRNRFRLESIQIKSDGVVKRHYALSYETSPVTEVSRLKQITECADSTQSNCFLPTVFSYQAGQPGLSGGGASGPAGSSNNIVAGRYDLNGDNRDDIAFKIGNAWYVSFGTAAGFSAPVSTGVSSPLTTLLIGRFLPNGRDAIVQPGSPDRIVRWDDGAASFVSVNSNVSHPIFPIAADYDGDGLADLITSSGKFLRIRRNTSSSMANLSFSSTDLVTADLSSNWNTSWSAIYSFLGGGLQHTDFNGDGRQDIAGTILVSSGQGVPSIYLVNVEASGAGYVDKQPWTDRAYPAIKFNDDACTDRVSAVQIFISSCNGSSATTIALPAAPQVLLDWDGDGKTDILVDNGGVFGVYRSTGAGLASLTTTSISSAGTFFALDIDGDRQDDLVKVNGTSAVSYWTHTSTSAPAYASNIPDLLSSVTDGFGVSQSVDYISTAAGNHDAGTPSALPLQESDAKIVVARSTHADGIGGTFNKTYYYSGARDITTRAGEFAGFQRMDETDSRTGVTTKTYFDQDFPRNGRVRQREILQSNGTLIYRTEITNTPVVLEPAQYNERHFVYTSKVIETRKEVGAKSGQTVSTRVTNFTNVDSVNGNVRNVETVLTDTDYGSPASPTAGATWTTTTQLQFSPDSANWCLGVPTQQLVTQSSSATGSGSAVTRRVDFEVDYPKCRVSRSTVEPGSTAYWLQSTYEFDDDPGNPLPDFGNVSKVTIAGAGVPARSTGMTWTSAGQFPSTATNALGQQSSFGYDFARGVRTSETDPNGLVTSYEYDAFARPSKKIRPDGTSSGARLVDCVVLSNCTSRVRALVVFEEFASNRAPIRADQNIIDSFGRPVQVWRRTMNAGASEVWSVTATTYDSLGRVGAQSSPCLTRWPGPCPQSQTSYSYDLLGRTTLISRPTSAVNSAQHLTSIDYRGAFAEITDSQGKKRVGYSDPNGWSRKIRDHNNYGQDLTYDPAGSLLSVSDSNGVALLYGVQYAYGVAAYQTSAIDADMGPRTQRYDALGELVGWTDAKGQSFQATFDELSRPLSRTEPDQKTFWVWGAAADNTAAAKFIGRLRDARTETPGGTQTYRDFFAYDSMGRLSQHTVSIPGEPDFTYDYAYHATLGLLESMQFPSAVGARPKVAYEYRYGQLVKVTNGAGTPTVYWEAKKANELNLVSEEALGNSLTTKRSVDPVSGVLDWIRTGVTGSGNDSSLQDLSYLYDSAGNVTQRQNGLLGLTEDYHYDHSYRLDDTHLVGQPNPTVDFSYQANGNLETNTAFAGTYNYTTAQSGCSYYAHSQPHAVRSVGSTVYCYDPNGNMVSRGGNSINWTSYNYPSQIDSAGQRAQFSYGPDRQRWKMMFNDGTNTETTFYIGNAFEKVTSAALGTVYRHTISAGGAPIAILTRDGAGSDTLRYVLGDHQGSIETLATSSGAVEARESFSPFGARRNADTWVGGLPEADGAALDGKTRQGYTYQTVLGAMGLTHMNGRVQDALSGRFISSDPFIPDPGDPQSYNRYSYVRNNPLSFVDPSGFTPQCTPYPMVWRDDNGQNHIVPGYSCPPDRPSFPGLPAWGPINETPRYGGGPATTGGTESWQGVHAGSILQYEQQRHIERLKQISGWNWWHRELFSYQHPAVYECYGNASFCNVQGPMLTEVVTNGDVVTAVGTTVAAAVAGEVVAAEFAGGGLVGGEMFAVTRLAANSDHIVLGLRAFQLESTAAKVGGRTLLTDANWMQSLKTALHTAGTRFTVSVEGLTGNGVRSQVMNSVQRGLGASGGYADWELAQLYQAGRMGDVTFVNSAGEILANPFK